MEKNIVIGIEGLVGSGKTSICRQMLEYIPNSIVLNGGNLYRAIVYALLSTGKTLEELKKELKEFDINQLIEKFKLKIEIENRETVFYINDKKISEEDLQSESSSLGVSTISQVADNSKLYLFGRSLIDNLLEKFNIIFSRKSYFRNIS